jgi:Protein of unknown function (DUF3040)
MPLSEDEQRILQQIEQQFYESDPDFAQQVSASGLERHAGRNLKLGIVGFLLGIVAVVATLPIHVALAFGGFLLMLGSLLLVDRSARTLGRQGLRRVTGQLLGGRWRERLGGSTPRRRRGD